MAIALDQVVPLGRSLDEYITMFNLSEADLGRNLLSVADGPASFNAELSAQGGQVTSIDPIYTFTAEQIQDKFHAVLDPIMNQIRATSEDWVWSYHASIAALRANRVRVMELFIEDYQRDRAATRYIVGELPHLPFEDHQFDLALCSHFLFLYSAHFSEAFHLNSVLELLRVAQEVRIFPLVTLASEISPYLKPVQAQLAQAGYRVEVQPVAYELQRGGNQMLVVRGDRP